MPVNDRSWNDTLKDRDWIRQSFLLSEDNIYEQSVQYRVFNTAQMKYTTSRLGYNWAINPAPQRTRFADIKFGGDRAAANRLTAMIDRKKSKIDITADNKLFKQDVKNTGTATLGMGRWYSEAIDDNAQLIHMSFGVPDYKGLVSFFTGFYDHGLGMLANEGRSTGVFYTAGKVLGFVVILPYWKWLLFGRIGNWIVNGGAPPTAYYSMNRKMHLYWKRADFIANSIAANMGIAPRTFDDPWNADASKQTQTSEIDKVYSSWFSKNAPDIFRTNGTIDIYKVASRAQRLANERYKAMEQLSGKNRGIEEMRGALAVYLETWNYTTSDATADLDKALKDYFSLPFNQAATSKMSKTSENLQAALDAKLAGSDDLANVIGAESATAADQTTNIKDVLYPAGAEYNAEKGTWDNIKNWFLSEESRKMMQAETNQGSQWITFKVDYNGTMQETFTNSFTTPSIKEKLNGMSRSARSARFDFSDGKMGIPLLDQAVGALQEFVTGGLDSIGLSGLMSLAGSAYVDIPDVWENSQADFSTQSFTIKLRPWAGNKMSQYLYMYVPLACLLAGALPISTGPQSFSSPFLCEMWSRGRNQIRLGMIDSLSITRGTGNMGWTNENEPLGIDVTFSVKDLSTVLHAPISSLSGSGIGAIVNPIPTLFPNDSKFNDYLAVLGNLSMADQTQAMRKFALNLTRYGLQWDSYWSKSRFWNWYGGSWVGELASNFTRDSERIVSY